MNQCSEQYFTTEALSSQSSEHFLIKILCTTIIEKFRRLRKFCTDAELLSK
jgi:hypothetical protein